jgi:hypothetical protein
MAYYPHQAALATLRWHLSQQSAAQHTASMAGRFQQQPQQQQQEQPAQHWWVQAEPVAQGGSWQAIQGAMVQPAGAKQAAGQPLPPPPPGQPLLPQAGRCGGPSLFWDVLQRGKENQPSRSGPVMGTAGLGSSIPPERALPPLPPAYLHHRR